MAGYRKLMIALIIGVALLGVYIYIEISVFQRDEIRIKSEKIKKSIAFIHITDYHGNDRINLEALNKAIADEKADGIFFTGDMQDNYQVSTEKSLRLFRNLRKLNLPMVAVLGNHEEGPKREDYITQMEALGVTVLQNQSITLNIKGNKLRIIGMNYEPDIVKYRKLKEENKEAFQLVLIHASHKIRSVVDGKEDLILSGHTHGGQCRLPYIGALYAPGEGFFPEYDGGLYEIEGKTKLYVNTGLGNTLFPLRFLNSVKYARIEISGE